MKRRSFAPVVQRASASEMKEEKTPVALYEVEAKSNGVVLAWTVPSDGIAGPFEFTIDEIVGGEFASVKLLVRRAGVVLTALFNLRLGKSVLSERFRVFAGEHVRMFLCAVLDKDLNPVEGTAKGFWVSFEVKGKETKCESLASTLPEVSNEGSDPIFGLAETPKA